MHAGQTGAWFDTTSWSLILRAQDDPGDLDRLVRAYWSPVYAFIRRKGYNPHDASDLTQGFLTEVVLGRGILRRADRARGRFRALLKTSLRNYLVDVHRRCLRRFGPLAASLDAGLEHPSEADADDAPGAAFDRQWGATVLALTLDRLEAACETDGMTGHWEAFRRNIAAPTLGRARPLPLDELAPLIGAADAAQASNMLQTMKRRFRAMLREVVAETVADPADVDDELERLKGVM